MPSCPKYLEQGGQGIKPCLNWSFLKPFKRPSKKKSKVALHSQFGSMKWKLHLAKIRSQMTFEWNMQYNVIRKLCSKIIILHLRTFKLESI